MFDNKDKLQQYLKDNSYVIFVNKVFEWKKQVLSYCDKHSDIKIVEGEDVLKLFELYCFSDKFILLSESEQYGGIWNLVRQKIINPDEAIEAIFQRDIDD